MNKLFYQDKPIVGLDINQTGIKIMAIHPKNRKVLGYGAIDVDPLQIREALETDKINYLTENIRLLLKEKIIGTLPSNHVVVGLPTGRSFSRTFTLPAKEEKNLHSAVEIEVEQYIPIPIGILYIDYEIIERTKDTLTVVMCAMSKSLIDNALKACEEANLRPVMVEPSINAVARVIERVEEGQLSTLIVDIGPANTDIAVFEKTAIRVSGGVSVGANTFTLDIAKRLNVPLENAHQLKVLNGLNAGLRQAKLTAALKPSLQRITNEIKKVIRYYNERLNEKHKIEQVLIVGSGSNVPGIGEYFTNELVMAARVASPWQELDFNELAQPAKQFRSRYITAAGLASVDQESVRQ